VREHLDRGDTTLPQLLTQRESQVVKLIAEGATSKEIARTLSISQNTVERHRENVLKKPGMRDRTQLTRFAIRHGLIEP
jgi:DNA-binding NarL/FixJ family response regulator